MTLETMPAIAPLALSCGEPAGIGPDLVLSLAQEPRHLPLLALGDMDCLAARARQLNLDIQLREWQSGPTTQDAGELSVLPIPTRNPVRAGTLDPQNGQHVLSLLETGAQGCLEGRFSGLITAPVNKAVINDAGINFSGHTEFLADYTGGQQPVMMLACPGLRVALLTTHIPLKDVPGAITRDRIHSVTRVLHGELQDKFGLVNPRILVCGLNPHAGESGHLGREEIEIIDPALSELRDQGIDLSPAMPADTLFNPDKLANADAVLAMYHDQGLPVLKHKGFGRAVNITLGLPIIRTSVDHGTALDLAGTGRANNGSLRAAIHEAKTMAEHQAQRGLSPSGTGNHV